MPDAVTLLVGNSLFDQNLYYKTHFLAGDPFIYAEAGDRNLLVVGGMEQSRARKESVVNDVRSFEDFDYMTLVHEMGDPDTAFATVLERIVREFGADAVRSSLLFPAFYADRLRSAGLTVDIDPGLFISDRRRKSAEEVARIEEAQRATERALERALEILRQSEQKDDVLHFAGIPLTSERLASEIEMSLLRDGMETSEGLIVAGGPGAADPHWQGTGPLHPGESIVFDIFPRSKQSRYFADMTRTLVVGSPSSQLQAMYDSVLKAQEVALNMVGPGVNGRDIHEAVKASFREDGFDREDGGPQYTHGTGHGLGLAVHEQPGISRRDEELLPGDVVTVEPGLYDPDIGAIRIEDMVLVTDQGCRNLTHFSKSFQV